jgi:membrane glycosyltransferase
MPFGREKGRYNLQSDDPLMTGGSSVVEMDESFILELSAVILCCIANAFAPSMLQYFVVMMSGSERRAIKIKA